MNAAQLTALTLRSTTVRAPLTWLQSEALPVAFRACYLCIHGAEEGIERVCTKPEAVDYGPPQPIAIVRAWGGGCGPDANHMCERAQP